MSFLLTCEIYFFVHKYQHLQLQIYLSFHFIYTMFNDKILVLLHMKSKSLFQEYSSSIIKWMPWQFIVVQMNMIFSVFVCVILWKYECDYVWVCVYVWFFVWEPMCLCTCASLCEYVSVSINRSMFNCFTGSRRKYQSTWNVMCKSKVLATKCNPMKEQ